MQPKKLRPKRKKNNLENDGQIINKVKIKLCSTVNKVHTIHYCPKPLDLLMPKEKEEGKKLEKTKK